jgi:hypothetical protein
VPDLSKLAGRPLDDTLPPLNELIKVLSAAEAAIPVG